MAGVADLELRGRDVSWSSTIQQAGEKLKGLTAQAGESGNRITSAGMDPDGQTLLVNDFQATAGNGDATLTGTCHPDSRVAVQHGKYVEWSFDSPSGDISGPTCSSPPARRSWSAARPPTGTASASRSRCPEGRLGFVGLARAW
jgi:hypothetical protein